MRSTRLSASDDDRGALAVSYLRVSTPRQLNTGSDVDADGNSIATQRIETLRKVRELGASLAHEFVEPGQSAQTIAKRPELQKLLQYVDVHPDVKYVVIYMRSRAFRNFTDAAITKRALLEKGVRLVSAKEEFGEGYMADAMEAITDIMNEVQVRMNGEDVSLKMEHKVKQGGTVGRAKLGYLNVRKDFEGRLVNTIDVDAERAAHITWAYEQYASGQYSPKQMTTALQRRGLTTRPSPSRPAHPLHRRLVSLMLRDPYYRGIIQYKGKLYTGRHQPLISEGVFEAVQQVLATQAGEGTRDVVHLHYLRGKIFCGECRKAGRPGRMVFSRNRGRGGTYDYLVCAAHQRRLCTAPTVRVDLVEARLAALMAAERLPLGTKVRLPEPINNLGALWTTAPNAMKRDLLAAFFKDIVIYTSVSSRSAS